MSNRLPIPGSDNGTWGDILNAYLEVSLSSDGTLQTSALTQAGGEVSSNKGIPSGYASLNASGLVPSTQLGSGSATSSNFLRGDGTWVVPNSGSSSLAADSDTAIVSPANGQVLTYNTSASKWQNIAPAVASVAVNNGTAQTGAVNVTAVQVAGDIGGTAASPTVSKIQGITISGTPSNGQALVASSSSAAAWGTTLSASQLPSSVVSASSPPTYYLMPSGSDDTSAVQTVLNAIVAAGSPARIVCLGWLLVTGAVSLTNATAQITIDGPGGFRFPNGVAAGSWLLRLVNSPNVTVRCGFDQNGANQSGSNAIYGLYYDTNSANLTVTEARFLNIKSFGFMSDGGLPTSRTNNVVFANNFVSCSANTNNDIVIAVANGGAVTGNVVVGVGSGMGISIYESNQVSATGNTVVLTGQTGEGIAIASSTGCVVSGNSVWAGNGDACYQAFKEVDNGGARSQTDALFVGNTAGMYVGASAGPAAYVVDNASNTVITGGTVLSCWCVLLTSGTNGVVSVSDINAQGYNEVWYQNGTTTPNPVINNVGSTATALAPLASPALTGTPTAPTAAALTSNTQIATTAYADAAVSAKVPATVGTTYQPAYGGVTNASPTANLLYIQKIFIPFAATLTGISWGNNSTQAGNVLVGLFNSSGTKVAATNSTAMSGAYNSQLAAFTSAYSAAAGVYYIGIMASSASAVWNTAQAMGPVATAAQGSFALPSSISQPGTFSAPALGSYPQVCTY